MVDSLKRSCFAAQFQTSEKPKEKPPTGAKYKLPKSCKFCLFRHEFEPDEKGLADIGVTRITVLPACDYTFEIVRRVSERDLGDWGCSCVIIDNLLSRHRFNLANGASVLELGCGLGVPGLVCAALGADVALTDRVDRDDKVHNVMQLLQHNVAANFMGPAVRPPGISSGRAGFYEFAWGAERAHEIVAEFGYYDYVICADCVYQPVYGKSWKPLAETINILAGPHSEVFVALQRRSADGVDDFLDLLINQFRFLVQKHESQFKVATGVAYIELYNLRRVKETEMFHVDVQTSAMNRMNEKVTTDDVVSFWRGSGPLVRAGESLARPKSGVARPKSGVARPKSGVARPKSGASRPQSGVQHR